MDFSKRIIMLSHYAFNSYFGPDSKIQTLFPPIKYKGTSLKL